MKTWVGMICVWWNSPVSRMGAAKCHDLGLLLLSLSLTLCCTHTHTHTHAYWHLHLSLSPTCLLFQSAFALLCSATCSHSFNQSLYLQRLRSRLSVGLLYVVHCMCYLVYHRIKILYLVLSRLEMLRVSVFFSVSCCLFQLVRFHEVSLDWSPLDHRLQVLFCDFSVLCLRTTDCLVFCSFIKDRVYYPFAFGSLHSHCDTKIISSKIVFYFMQVFEKSCCTGSVWLSHWSSGYKSITSNRTGSEWR